MKKCSLYYLHFIFIFCIYLLFAQPALTANRQFELGIS